MALKEYKTSHDWVGKVRHWKLCRKSKFDHTNKWYMHNRAAVLRTETHKLLRNFNVQTDPLITARRPDLIIINKQKENWRNFTILQVLIVKLKVSEKKDKYLELKKNKL